MPYDPTNYSDWLRKHQEQYGVPNRPEPSAQPFRPAESPSVAKDLLMSPLRGLEGAAQDAWGLLDMVSFDALPDWDERLLGESKTTAGALAEGIFNFMAGFIPVAWVLTKVGRVAKVAKAAKLVKTAATGANELTLLGDLAAGAVADLVVFSKQDENLSTLIQSFPALANPVTEFLAIQEDDSEAVGRIKNVLEGAGLGALLEPFIAGLKAMRKRGAMLGEKKTVDQIVAELMNDETLGPIERGLAYRVPDYDLKVSSDFWVEDPSLTAPEKLNPDGTIQGTPGLTKETLKPIQRLMLKAAKRGEVGRYWYEESSKAIYQIVGGDMEKADKLAKALAVTSPKMGVPENAQRGLQAFHAWNRGVPLDEFLNSPKYRFGMDDLQQHKLAVALYGIEGKWYGRKTYNFYTNLMRSMDPNRPQGVTNDMWMARLFGFDSDSVPDRGYDFMQREVESIADRLGWEPYQVQASMWTYTKALWEAYMPGWKKEAAAAGMDLKSKDFDRWARRKFQEKVAQDLGLGKRGFKVEDSYSFLQGLHEKPIVLSHEVLPFDYPFEAVSSKDRILYSAERRAAFIDPETGIDEVSKEIGWGPKDYPAGSGSVPLPSTTPKGGEGARAIEPGTFDLVKKWGYLHAVVSGQREVFMVRTWDKSVTGKGANALKIDLGRPVTTADSLEALHLMRVLGLDPETTKAFSKEGSLYFARVDGKELKLDGQKAGRLVNKFNQIPVNTELWNPKPVQRFTSAATDVNQSAGKMPALFSQIQFEKGTTNIDIGGGKGDLVTQRLGKKGVTNLVFDPFNRPASHNRKVAALVANGRADTATIANVLNVIEEAGNRDLVIRQAADSLKPEGKAYFQIYAGSGDGIGSPTPKGWQNNRKAEDYMEEISKWFGKVERKGQTIIASEPRLEANPLRMDPKYQFAQSEYKITNAYAEVFHDQARTPEELRQRALGLGYGESLERVESRVGPRLASVDAKHRTRRGVGAADGDVRDAERVVFLRDPDGEPQSVDGLRAELDDLAKQSRNSFFVTHGSPRKFDRWKSSRRSHGDVHGWGAYASNDPRVSQSYRAGEGGEGPTLWVNYEDFDPLNLASRDESIVYNAMRETMNEDGSQNWDKVRKFLDRRHPDAEGAYKVAEEWSQGDAFVEMPGYHYTFEVAGDAKADFLNWTGKAGDQPQKLLDAIDQELPHLKDPEMTGGELYNALAKRLGSKKRASQWLRSRGIRGNRVGEGAGSTFVLFDPRDFKIKRRVSGMLGSETRTFYADFDTLAEQLDKDVQIGAYNHPRDIEAVQEFVRRVGSDLFNGVSLRVAMGERASSYEYISKVVTLGGQAIRSGNIKRDLLHEFWHHLSRNIEPRYRQAVEEAYAKDLANALRKDPSLEARIRSKRERLGTELQAPPGKGLGNAEYRYLSVDEWFAEVMTERSLDKLELFKAADQGGIKGIIAHARLWWTEMLNAMRARFGGDRTHKLLDDFLRGRREAKMQDYYGVGGIEQAKMWRDPDAPPTPAAVLRHLGIDPQKSEEIAADLAQRIKDGRDPKLNPRNLTEEELVYEGLKANDLNLSHWAGRDDGLTLLRVMEDLYRGIMEKDVKSLNRPQSFEKQTAAALRERAAILGEEEATSAARWRASMKQDQANLRQAVSRIYAHKTLLMGLGDELATMAKAIQQGNGGPRQLAEFAQASQFYAEMLAGVKGLNAEVGRGLGFMRRNVIPFDKVDLSKQDLDAYLQGHGGSAKIEKLAEQIGTAFADGGVTGTASAARIVQATWRRQGVSIFNEYWINALLSGPRTLVVNFLSGAMMSLYRPLELMLGGAMYNVRNLTASGVFSEGAEELTRLINVFGENQRASFKFAARAVQDDVGPILTGRAMFEDRPRGQQHAIAVTGDKANTLWGTSINWLGRQVRIPTRLMAGGDEYIKQMNYRAVAQTHFTREGKLMGKTGAALAKHVEDQMDKLIYEGQAYTQETLYRRGLNEAKTQGILDEVDAREFAAKYVDDNWDEDLSALSKLAREAAEEVTFSRPLDHGSVSDWLQRTVNAHPMLRIILPFIRTPVNIAGFAHQRLNPVYLAKGFMTAMFPPKAGALSSSRSKIVQGLLSSNPRTQAEAMGRLGAGIGFWGLGTSLAMTGVITGRGPSDPEQRKVLEAEGWLPYSIKTSTGYVQYNRLDPFGTLLGVFADYTDYMKFAPPTNDAPMVYAVMAAIANNFTNKTYLTGVRNMVDALTDPDRKAEKWAQRMVGSMVPNVLGQGVGALDQDMREVRGMLDAMMSKVPGLAEMLPPQRNVLGEVTTRVQAIDVASLGDLGLPPEVARFTNWWQPINYSAVNDDIIGKEMAALGHGWTPPKIEKNGIDLTQFRNARGQDAYDRWGELQGTLRIGGKTLRESLRTLIQSRGYQNMTPESTPFADSPRIQAITNVITRYRRRAYDQLKREYSDLARTEREIFNQRREAKYGTRARRILER